METENLSELKINVLRSQEQFDNALTNDKINNNELYLVPDNQNYEILIPIRTEELTISPFAWYEKETIDSTTFYFASIVTELINEEDYIFYKVSSNYSSYEELKKWSKVASHIVDVSRDGPGDVRVIAAIPTGTKDQFLNDDCQLTITIIKGGNSK